jgi:hypothetical protein
MAAIVSGLHGGSDGKELEALGTRPARKTPSTWLTELRPLPRPGANEHRGTYIPEWFNLEFPTRAAFRQRSASISGPCILAALRRDPPPQYAFFYGLPACEWAEGEIAPFLAAPFDHKVEDIRTGRESAVTGLTIYGTVVVLTEFYNGRDTESAFRVEHVGGLLKSLSCS